METLKKYLPLIVIAVIGLYAIRKLGNGNGPSIRQVIPLTPSSEPAFTDPLLPFRAAGFESLVGAGVASSQQDLERERLRGEIDIAKQATSLATTQSQQEFELGQQSLLQQMQIAIRNFDLLSILGLREFEVQERLGTREFDLAEILGLKQSETQLAQTALQTELAKYLQAAQASQQQFLETSFLRQLELFYGQRNQDRQLQQRAIDRTTSSRGGNTAASIANSVSQAIGSIFGGTGRSGGGGSARTPSTFPSLFGF